MNYDQAKQIVSEHAPDLILDDEVKGQQHICVRATKSGMPFSIMLPTTLVDHGAADAEPVDEATAASQAEKKAAAERKTLTDALDAANRALGM